MHEDPFCKKCYDEMLNGKRKAEKVKKSTHEGTGSPLCLEHYKEEMNKRGRG